MRYMKLVSSLSLLVLAACGGSGRLPDPLVQVEYVEVPVIVTAPCVSGRPDPVDPLSTRYSEEQWVALPPGSKANAVWAQAGRRMNYQDRLEAATSGCLEADPE